MPQEVVIRETKTEETEENKGISWPWFFVWCFVVVFLAVYNG